MEANVQFEYRYRSRGLTVGSWSCTCPRPDRGAEEYTSFFEVVFLTAGAFVKHVGQRRTFADPNHVIFFNPGEAYRISHPVSRGDRCTIFFLTAESLCELLRPGSVELDGGRPSLRSDYALIDSHSYSLHRQLLRHLVAGEKVDPLAVDEIGMNLLHRVLATAAQSDNGPRPTQRPGTRRYRRLAIENVKQFLSAHVSEPVTLEEVANATYYSKYHLARLFRSATGLPIHRYLNRLRLRTALERLMEPATDLSRLAMEIGFSSHSHFSNAFRREFGCPPSEIRGKAPSRALSELRKNLQA